MNLSKSAILEFKDIYETYYNEYISYDEAKLLASNFMNFIGNVTRIKNGKD